MVSSFVNNRLLLKFDEMTKQFKPKNLCILAYMTLNPIMIILKNNILMVGLEERVLIKNLGVVIINNIYENISS